MKPISEMTSTEKIVHIRRLKRAGVTLDHIKELMGANSYQLRVIFDPHNTFTTSEELAHRLNF